jgi:DNA-directed RNA polymerase specialized sigma24 family protein
MGGNGFEMTVRRLFDVARLATGDDRDAEEAVRAAVWAGHLARGRVPPGPRAAVWLFGALRVELMERLEPERTLPEPEPVDPDDPLDAITAQLWDATRSLSVVDRVVLALHLRSGLAADDLARVLGVRPRHAYRLTTAARTRAVSALLPLVPTGASPLSLLSGTPRVAIPPGLETPALLQPGPEPVRPLKIGRGGFPGPRIVPFVRAPSLALLVALLVVIAAFALVATANRGGSRAAQVATDGSVPLGSSTVTTSDRTTTTAAPEHGLLSISATTVDLGVESTYAPFYVANDGVAPLDWTATADTTALVILPTNGTLAPGARARVDITLIRDRAGEGDFRHEVALAAAEAGAGSVLVAATIEHPPVIAGVALDPETLVMGNCAGADESTLAVTATDESGVAGVALEWQQAEGQPTASALELGGDGLWYGTIGPVKDVADVAWSVTAVDTRGNRATLDGQFLPVTPCAPE